MQNEDELLLKVTKEIVIKFIETGRLSLNLFEEGWHRVFNTVKSSLQEREDKD